MILAKPSEDEPKLSFSVAPKPPSPEDPKLPLSEVPKLLEPPPNDPEDRPAIVRMHKTHTHKRT